MKFSHILTLLILDLVAILSVQYVFSNGSSLDATAYAEVGTSLWIVPFVAVF